MWNGIPTVPNHVSTTPMHAPQPQPVGPARIQPAPVQWAPNALGGSGANPMPRAFPEKVRDWFRGFKFGVKK
jgi:hypothetical protein